MKVLLAISLVINVILVRLGLILIHMVKEAEIDAQNAREGLDT